MSSLRAFPRLRNLAANTFVEYEATRSLC